MKPLFLNQESYEQIGVQDNREDAIKEIADFGLTEDDILEFENFIKMEMPDGFFLLCSECEKVSVELHEVVRQICTKNGDFIYSPFRVLENELEMVIEKECLGIDPYHYISQYKATSPKLKHPFLYSNECGITSQYFHFEDYQTILEMLKSQLN